MKAVDEKLLAYYILDVFYFLLSFVFFWLFRLLGPHDTHITFGGNNLLGGTQEMRESARVVVMDNFGVLPSHEEQIDIVDQSGYLFGPGLAATLSHVPPVLHWWNMESKCLDLESVYDCTTSVCNKLIPTLIKYRNEELLAKKAKEDEEKNKKRNTTASTTIPPTTTTTTTTISNSNKTQTEDNNSSSSTIVFLDDADVQHAENPAEREG